MNQHGIVQDVSESVPGSVHDRTLFSESGVAEKIPKDALVGGDLGYQGIQDDLPHHNVLLPFKNSKLHPLTDDKNNSIENFPPAASLSKTPSANSKSSKLCLNDSVMTLTNMTMFSVRSWLSSTPVSRNECFWQQLHNNLQGEGRLFLLYYFARILLAQVQTICTQLGYATPIVCTPEALLGGQDDTMA